MAKKKLQKNSQRKKKQLVRLTGKKDEILKRVSSPSDTNIAKKDTIRVEIDPTSNLLFINDVPYVTSGTKTEKIDGITHLRKIIYKPASKDEINAAIHKIVKAISPKTTKEELLRELIKEKMSMRGISKVGKQIDKKAEIKKHEGCLGFKIGSEYVQLIH